MIKKRNRVAEWAAHAYIRRVKKWMFCPACQNGKMTIDKKSDMWTCRGCGYKLSADEFENDYVFWFCDECGTYLNNQAGFHLHGSRHICQICGYENDCTIENIKGICSDCGCVIPDRESTLCADCKQHRRQKAKEWLKTAGRVVGGAAIAAGALYFASLSTGDNEDEDWDDEDESPMVFGYVTDSWLETASEDELRETASEMETMMDEMDYDSEEHTKIYGTHVDVVNAIASRFPLNLPHREHGWYLPNDED